MAAGTARDDLLACLESVVPQLDDADSVFVVDNGSEDGSADMVADEFPSVRIVWNSVNRGFAAANNQG